MNLAFYAPMKRPDHPVPSGDRNIARSLLAALQHLNAHVTVASTLRSRDGIGNADTQHRIIAAAQSEVERLVPIGRSAGWQAWITYHNYYKAPDLIGPAVCRVLNIPYLQIESTRAKKRLRGPWAEFAQRAEAATDAADAIFYFTTRDAQSLHEHARPDQFLMHLKPFLVRSDVPEPVTANGPILSVGMMRAGDKLASYQLIAETLALLKSDHWQLEIAGDGAERACVEAWMTPFADRIRFLGQLDHDALQHAFKRASIMFWPGVHEAFGLSYLEAQLAGLPVVAQDRPGMREVLAPFHYPAVQDGAAGLAEMLDHFLKHPEMRHQQGEAAREFVRKGHLMPAAAQTLKAGLAHVGITS